MRTRLRQQRRRQAQRSGLAGFEDGAHGGMIERVCNGASAQSDVDRFPTLGVSVMDAKIFTRPFPLTLSPSHLKPAWYRCKALSMSVTELASTATPEQLRPLLHQQIDAMDNAHLAELRQVMLELRLREITDELDAAFDADRDAGKLAQIPEIIRRVRERRQIAGTE